MSMEPLRSTPDDELGAALARAIDWPPTPDLPSIVAAAIEETERAPAPIRPRLSLPSRRRTVLVLVAAFLALAAAAVAAKLVFDIGAIEIRTIPTGTLPSPVLTGHAIGRVTTLADAAQEAFPPLVPGELGAPDRVWVDVVGGNERVVLGWAATEEVPPIDELAWGAVLYEFRGDTEMAVKTAYSEQPGIAIRSVHVNGHPAFWLTGAHEIDLLTSDGRFARYRVTGNVLIWQHGDLTLRLETGADLGTALAIARSA